ncbi:proline iminopeptidase [Glycocaulis alkaliphilus]|uniref:Proline iminopeptidase n=1 Tax=Glycocaulis alkaliphilus TaxID=1434191 RepID=A0A3T0E997_9PROT|nr:prolyl aminopeptidase [Glycocaulis alkaliphilus]AZU03889.1 proline iminopeptidase [Glycocaulis alkaliphilus]GGB85842.1 proline iminopeptidase [Glycocaulis alkaliphilus]
MIEPYRTGMMDVGEGHTLYYEECGRADGVPIIALHGGPGGGAAPSMRRFFDPHVYRIIIFDQRGCGRSRPFSDIRANDTHRLVADMETIRSALGVERWIVFGGSWGATLSLAYARACPERVMGLILRGVFGCTKAELDWFYRDGANRIFPDAWQALTGRLTAEERGDVLRAYHARLQADELDTRREDALAWAQWENALISLVHESDAPPPDARRADALARMETHYFVNNGFLERDGVLLDNTAHLTGIPGVIVQGRYDMVTPVRAAWQLRRNWTSAELHIVPDAGHAAGEPGIVDALVRATDRLGAELG